MFFFSDDGRRRCYNDDPLLPQTAGIDSCPSDPAWFEHVVSFSAEDCASPRE